MREGQGRWLDRACYAKLHAIVTGLRVFLDVGEVGIDPFAREALPRALSISSEDMITIAAKRG
jgi:hypothetical protein